jgi:BMFP domain-containing protein YqiC
MSDRPRFFDDLAGVAGGAMSALVGLRDEAESIVRARLDEAIRRLELVKRDEIEALTELAAKAREGQEAAETRLAEAERRIAVLEDRFAALQAQNQAE